MCCPAAVLGGCPIAWSGKDSGSTDVLTALLGPKCPSAQILSQFGAAGERESGLLGERERVSLPKPVAHCDICWRKQENVGFLP